MIIPRGWWRLYSLVRHFMRGLLPPRRVDFRACGTGVFVHHHVHFANCEQISFENDIYVGPHCKFFGDGGIHIEKHVVLGESVTLIGSNHRFEGHDLTKVPFDDGTAKVEIHIGCGAWIGQNALILPGVNLGAYSIIAAGSVVTRDTKPYGIYAGAPARFVRCREMPADRDLETLPSWAASKPQRYTLY